MHWLKLPSLRFPLVLAAFAILVAAETLTLLHWRAVAAASRDKLAAAIRNLHVMMGGKESAPTLENLERSQIGCRTALQSLETVRAALMGVRSEPDQPRVSASLPERAGAYFDLARFVDGLAELCLAEEIEIPEDLRFGFATHANTAPGADLIPALVQQSEAIEDLVAGLVAAKPRRIEFVRRQNPGLRDDMKDGASLMTSKSRAPSVASDYFVHDGQSVVARSLGLNALAFQVGFIGTSACLRQFVNRLASRGTPWCVTLVEARSTAGPGPGNASHDRMAGRGDAARRCSQIGPVPLRFIVTAEWIRGVAEEGAGVTNKVSG